MPNRGCFIWRCVTLVAALHVLCLHVSCVWGDEGQRSEAEKALRASMEKARENASKVTSGRVQISAISTGSKPLGLKQLGYPIPPERIDATGEILIDYWFNSQKDQWRIDCAPTALDQRLEKGFRWSWDGDAIRTCLYNGERRREGKSSDEAFFNDAADSSIVFNVTTLPFTPNETFFGLQFDERVRWWTPMTVFSMPDGPLDVTRFESNGAVGFRVKHLEETPGRFYVVEYLFREQTGEPLGRQIIDHYPNPAEDPRVDFSTQGEWSDVSGVMVPTRTIFYDLTIAHPPALIAEQMDLTLQWVSVNRPIDESVFRLEINKDPNGKLGNQPRADTKDSARDPERAYRMELFEKRRVEIARENTSAWLLWVGIPMVLAVAAGWYLWRKSR